MQSADTKVLFTPYKVGYLTLKNRFVMAAMTRCRADPKTAIPGDLHVQYYAQRASAGLILSECAPITPTGQSFLGNGGLWNDEQVQGWKRVTDAVHSKGGKIFVQIWHAGRAAVPALVGGDNLAPSPIAIKGNLFGDVAFQVPKEMTKEDIKMVVDQFRQGALNAKKAGFDGVELHGANGYLVDQFLRTSANQRTDEYGGSAENRARFCLQVMDALIGVYGANKVGIKLSPVGRYQDMYDTDPLETYTYVVKELDKRGIAFIEFVEADSAGEAQGEMEAPKKQMPEVSKQLRSFFKGTVIINNEQTPESGAKAIKEGTAQLVSFAKKYLANPDYVERVKNNWPLNDMHADTLYFGGEKGYIDYPIHKAPKSTGGIFGCFTK